MKEQVGAVHEIIDNHLFGIAWELSSFLVDPGCSVIWSRVYDTQPTVGRSAK